MVAVYVIGGEKCEEKCGDGEDEDVGEGGGDGDGDGEGVGRVLWRGKKWSRRFLLYGRHTWVASYSLLRQINGDNEDL